MKGLELSKAYYEAYGAPMLENDFPDLVTKIAVGLVGMGSECLGYDDDISTDHDFEPGFCMFLPEEDVVDRRSAFLLERAYAKLPDEFMGYRRNRLNPVGGNRHGVLRLSEFLTSRLGAKFPDDNAWMQIPEQYFLEVISGELFRDDVGDFTRIRNYFSKMPEDVRKKKLAGELVMMEQGGQYNYTRCLQHGETGAAQLAAVEFTKAAMHVVFLLNGRFMPYYKWRFRALRELVLLSDTAPLFEMILTTGNEGDAVEKKIAAADRITEEITGELLAQGLIKEGGKDPEALAYEVNNTIEDGWIRNLHILYAV